MVTGNAGIAGKGMKKISLWTLVFEQPGEMLGKVSFDHEKGLSA